MKNSYKFFANTECRYFPCHENVDSDHFNCLFCYCPLYLLGERCSGNFEYVGQSKDVKCCTKCVFPHNPSNYDLIIEKLQEIVRSGAET
jgi:Zn-finger protein